MGKHKIGYVIGVVFCLGSSLTALLSLAAPAPNISTAQSPTLTPAPPEKIDAINQLIRDKTCELPCWWGLTLGKSTIAEVKARLIEIFGRENISVFKEFPYTIIGGELTVISPNYLDPSSLEERAYNFSKIVWVDSESNNLVALALRVPIPQHHSVDWTPYTAKSILAKYGEPESIVYFGPYMYGDCCINLILRYPSLGVYVHYLIGVTYIENRQYIICNNLTDISFDGIRLWLEAEELNLESLGLWQLARYEAPREQNIEDVTGLTKAEFTELFSQENACVTVTY